MDAAELFVGFDRFAMTLDDDEDGWLSVTVDVRAGQLAWKQVDSCLSVADATQLADWMDAPKGACAFAEGNLSFACDGETISVSLDLEFAAPNWESDKAFVLEAPVEQGAAFAQAVRTQLQDLLD